MTVKDLLMANCSDVVSVKLFEPAGPNGEKGKLLCESNGSKYDFEKFLIGKYMYGKCMVIILLV